jgi:hypothetical protein
MKPGVAGALTLCPSTSSIPFMAQSGGTGGAAITFAINDCRPAPVTCAAGAVTIRSNDGVTVVGCLAAGATTCPGASATQNGALTASPYSFPFMLVGTGVEECRQATVLPSASVTDPCKTFLGTSTNFTTAIVQFTNANSLAGCARSPAITACPAGYLAVYNSAQMRGCQTAATCTVGTANTIIADATGATIGCGTASSCVAANAGDATVYGANAVTLRDAANSAAVKCCMPSTATTCPSAYFFYVYGAPASGRVPLLRECWSAGTSCGGAQVGTSVLNAATVEMYTTAGNPPTGQVRPKAGCCNHGACLEDPTMLA